MSASHLRVETGFSGGSEHHVTRPHVGHTGSDEAIPAHQRTVALLQKQQLTTAYAGAGGSAAGSPSHAYAGGQLPAVMHEGAPQHLHYAGAAVPPHDASLQPLAGAPAPHSPFNGPMSKTRVCRYYLSRMNNHFGRSCSYIHPCKLLLLEGHCKHGRRCTDDHVCRADLLGPGCASPEGCMYLHVRNEGDRAAMLDMHGDWLRLAAADGQLPLPAPGAAGPVPYAAGHGSHGLHGFPRAGSNPGGLDGLVVAFTAGMSLNEAGAAGGVPAGADREAASDTASNTSSNATAQGNASPTTVDTSAASPLLGPSTVAAPPHSARAQGPRMSTVSSSGSLLGLNATGSGLLPVHPGLTASVSVASFVSGGGGGTPLSAPGSPAFPGMSAAVATAGSPSVGAMPDAAAGSPMAPGGRLLCPFWYAETQSGCKAGQDCIFEHPGSIQLPDRPLPTPIQLRFASRAWERRRQQAAMAGAGATAAGASAGSPAAAAAHMSRSASSGNFSTASPVLGPAPAGVGASRGSPIASPMHGYHGHPHHGHHGAHASSPLAHQQPQPAGLSSQQQAAQAAALSAAAAAAAALSHGGGGSNGNLAGYAGHPSHHHLPQQQHAHHLAGQGGGRGHPLQASSSMSRSGSSTLLAGGRPHSGKLADEEGHGAAHMGGLLPRAGSTGGLAALGGSPVGPAGHHHHHHHHSSYHPLPPMSTHLPPLAPSQSVLELQSLILGGGGSGGGSYLGRAARSGSSGFHASASTGSMGSPLLQVASPSPAGLPRNVSGLGLPDAALGYSGPATYSIGGLSSVSENGTPAPAAAPLGASMSSLALQPVASHERFEPSGSGMRRDSSSTALGLGLGLDTAFSSSATGTGVTAFGASEAAAPPGLLGGLGGMSLLGGLGGVGRDLSRLLHAGPGEAGSAAAGGTAGAAAAPVRPPPGLGPSAAALNLKAPSASLASLLSGLAASPRPAPGIGGGASAADAAASAELGLSFGEDIVAGGAF